MPRSGILLLLSAGIALSAYEHLPPSADAPRGLAEITRISVAPDGTYRSDEVIRSFAPAKPSAHRETSESRSERRAQAAPLVRPGTWTTVVTPGQAIVSPIKSSRPADDATRVQLARDLQQELQRAGCYQGEITGSWTPGARRAMAAFMDRANAVLPYDQPDYVLLALVQGHREIACAMDCPSGQILEDGGRCVPRAVVAQAAKKSKRLEERRVAQHRLAEDRGRVATSGPEVLPWQKHEPAVAQANDIAMASRPEPLPGRMSIGGPVDVTPPRPSLSSAVPLGVVSTSEGAEVPTPGGSADTGASNKVAALQGYDADTDDLSDSATVTGADGAAPAVEGFTEVHKPRKARRSDRDARPRREYYASAGKRRHGDPRPGTARFNLMQSLGGIY